jgi:hypothetical protein
LVEDLIGHFKIGEDVQGVGVVIEQIMQLEDLAGDREIADDTRGLAAGSPPPARAARAISCAHLLKTRPLMASTLALMCLTLDHLL